MISQRLLQAVVVSILIISAHNVVAQTAVQEWAQRYTHLINADDFAQKVVADSFGNVLVAGRTEGDMVVIKYSGAGIALWTNGYNGPGHFDDPTAMVADGSGNVYLTGRSYGSPSTSSFDFATIAYAGNGDRLWAARYGGSADFVDQPSGIAVGANGDIFVTGYSRNNGTGNDYATIAYSHSGVPLWTNLYSSPGNFSDEAAAIAVGPDSVFVTGRAYNGSNDDYVTIAYSAAGLPLWTNSYNGSANSTDRATAIAVDADNNVFVTGQSSNGTNNDYATVAYSSTGVALWTNRYNGTANATDQALAIVVGGNGRVYVTGNSIGVGTSTDFATIAYSNGVALWTNRYTRTFSNSDEVKGMVVDSNDNILITGTSPDSFYGLDYVTVAYSSGGAPLWTNRYSGQGNTTDQANAIAVDNSGKLFVTGTASATGVTADFLTIAYTSAGGLVWTQRFGGLKPASSLARVIAVSSDGKVYVAGESRGFNSGLDYTTIAYSSDGVGLWTNRYNGPGNSDEEIAGIVTDSNGNVHVAGSSTGAGDPDYAIITYSSAGVALRTNRYSEGGWDQARDIAIDSNGRFYVTGFSSGAGDATVAYASNSLPLWTNRFLPTLPSDDRLAAITADGGRVFVTGYGLGLSTVDFMTIAYSSSGTALWTNFYNGPMNDGEEATAIASRNGRVFVTGPSPGSGMLPDYATVAYSHAGQQLWARRYDGPGSQIDIATAIAADATNVYVTGYSYGPGSLDYATIAYSATGVSLWTNRYGITNSNLAYAIAADNSGAVYVTGYSEGASLKADIVTIGYSAVGVPLWTNRYDGPANGSDLPAGKNSMAIGPDGSVYIAGISDAQYVTIKYAVSPQIRVQPESRTNLVGTLASFSVLASGTTPLAYQWFRNGMAIFSATNSSLVLDPVSQNDAASYMVVVTNIAGSVNSSPAVLTVAAPPPIVTSLQPNVPGPGSNTLSFTGAPDFTYIAQFSTNLANGLWFNFSTNIAAPNGQWTVIDSSATNAERYYRVTQP